MALARWVVMEGKAMIFVVNKMDQLNLPGQLNLKKKLKTAVPEEIHTAFPQVIATRALVIHKGIETLVLVFLRSQIGQVPIVYTSALTEDMKEKLLPVVEESYSRWCQRLTTGMLNRWLAKVRQFSLKYLS